MSPPLAPRRGRFLLLITSHPFPRLSVPEEPEGDIGSELELTFVKGKKSSRICLRGVRLLAPPPGEDEE